MSAPALRSCPAGYHGIHEGIGRQPVNHHWTKSLIASRDGRRLYVGVGSNSNIAENGMAHEVDRAAVLEIDPATGSTRDGRPAGPAEDVLAGFLSEDGKAHGRPVGVTVAADGALLVADDVGNAVWRVTPVQR